jgi:hypothetical protein
MSEVKVIPTVSFKVTIELTENEARALDAMACYGADNFLNVFYKHLGMAYMEPFDDDLRALFEKIKVIRPAIYDISEARKKLGLPRNGYR